jgi:hypothetical protein
VGNKKSFKKWWETKKKNFLIEFVEKKNFKGMEKKLWEKNII